MAWRGLLRVIGGLAVVAVTACSAGDAIESTEGVGAGHREGDIGSRRDRET